MEGTGCSYQNLLELHQIRQTPVLHGTVGHRAADDERQTTLGKLDAGNICDVRHVLGHGHIRPRPLAKLIGTHANDLSPLILCKKGG